MGWMFSQKRRAQSAKQFLDQEFSGVVRSAMVDDTYYAAMRSREGRVVGVVVLTDTTDRDGEFGYKAMEESVGPVASECPVAILDLLDPPPNTYGREWRARCRAFAARTRTREVARA